MPGPGTDFWGFGSGGGGTSDHGALTGLSDDDHPQYLLLSDVLDEDDMASDSATVPPSQQSVKAYADALNAPTPATVTGTTDTLAEGDRFRLTMYSNASAVTVTVPTGTFAAGDWFLLQATGAGGLSLSTSGITLNGSSPSVGVAQNEALLVIFTAANTVSVIGGTA